jgi:hypothetical protein
MNRVPFDLDTLKDYVADTTQLFGVAHPEQQSAWVARFAVARLRVNVKGCFR